MIVVGKGYVCRVYVMGGVIGRGVTSLSIWKGYGKAKKPKDCKTRWKK